MPKHWIEAGDVDEILTQSLPEFAGEVREHRSETPHESALYGLASRLFQFIIKGYRRPSLLTDDRKTIAKKAYAVVERFLSEGDSSVSEPFVSELIEPLAMDFDRLYPDLSQVMGEKALAVFHRIRGSYQRRGI